MPYASSVDWLAVGSVLQGAGTVVGAIAVIIAAKLGSSTFENWRRQKLSERRIEQAERILLATYRARRGLSYVRSPMMWPSELAEAEDQLKSIEGWEHKPKKDKERIKHAQVYYNRIISRREERRALEECQPMARALFGEDLEMSIEELNRQYQIVKYSADSYTRQNEFQDPKITCAINAALYEGYTAEDDSNKIDAAIKEQVENIEEICVPILRIDPKHLTR